MSFFYHKQTENSNNLEDTSDKINLQDFFQIKVIEPTHVYQYIKDNEILNIVYQDIIPKIKEKIINCYIVPLPLSEIDIWWTDYGPSYLAEFYGSGAVNNSYVYFEVKLNKDLTINLDETIKVYHDLSLEESQYVYDIFKEYLPYNFSWNGSVNQVMNLYYDKQSEPLASITLEKTNIYPCIEVYIEAKVKEKLDESYSINTFDDNPYELSDDFKLLWDEINSNSDVIDYGYSLSKDSNTFIIDFAVNSINNMEIIQKIKDLERITFDKFILEVTDVSGLILLNEDEEVDINE